MTLDELKLQLIVKSLHELGCDQLATELISQLRQTNSLDQQPGDELHNWILEQLRIRNYTELDDYFCSLLNDTNGLNEFVKIINYRGDNMDSIISILLYLIRRANYLDVIKLLDSLTDTEKLTYVNNKLLPLLDCVDVGNNKIEDISSVIDVRILQQLSKEKESKLLMDSNHAIEQYLFQLPIDSIHSLNQFIFDKLFNGSIFNLLTTDSLANTPDLATIIQQAAKYQQSQSPFYLPPRTKQERKKAPLPLPLKRFHDNFNGNTTTLLHTLTYHKDEVWFVKFSPSGKFLVTGSLDGRLVLYDVLNNFQLIKVLEPTMAADNTAFSPISTRPTLSKNNKAVIYCCWDPKEQYIVSCCLDTVIRVWSVGDIHKRRITRSETNTITDYKLITCFTLAPDIKTWTCEFLPENRKLSGDLNGQSDSPQFIVGSPDKVLKIFDCNGIELFDFYGNIEDEDERENEQSNQNQDEHPALNPNLQQQQQPLLASSTSTSSQSHGQTTSTTAEEANKHDDISMKDTDESLPRVRTYKTSLESNFNRINDLVITNNGKILITLNDHQLHFYTVPDTLGEEATTRRICNIHFKGRLTSCSISHNGKYLLISSAPEELQVWDLSPLLVNESNRPILYRKYLGHTQSSYIVRSTLGYLNEDNDQEELVLTGSDHGYIYFWKFTTGQLITRIKGHVGLCNGVDWNRNGMVIKGKDYGKIWASVGDDKLVKIWGSK